jgi:hypothetical protein
VPRTQNGEQTVSCISDVGKIEYLPAEEWNWNSYLTPHKDLIPNG